MKIPAHRAPVSTLYCVRHQPPLVHKVLKPSAELLAIMCAAKFWQRLIADHAARLHPVPFGALSICGSAALEFGIQSPSVAELPPAHLLSETTHSHKKG